MSYSHNAGQPKEQQPHHRISGSMLSPQRSSNGLDPNNASRLGAPHERYMSPPQPPGYLTRHPNDAFELTVGENEDASFREFVPMRPLRGPLPRQAAHFDPQFGSDTEGEGGEGYGDEDDMAYSGDGKNTLFGAAMERNHALANHIIHKLRKKHGLTSSGRSRRGGQTADVGGASNPSLPAALVAEVNRVVPSQHRRCALHIAVIQRDIEMVELLVANGASMVDVLDADGETPFTLAIYTFPSAIPTFLSKLLSSTQGRKALKSWVDRENGHNLLHRLVSTTKGNANAFFAKLGMQGFKMAALKSAPTTFERLPILRQLVLDAGVSVTHRDDKGFTAAEWARENYLGLGAEAHDIIVFLTDPTARVAISNPHSPRSNSPEQSNGEGGFGSGPGSIPVQRGAGTRGLPTANSPPKPHSKPGICSSVSSAIGALFYAPLMRILVVLSVVALCVTQYCFDVSDREYSHQTVRSGSVPGYDGSAMYNTSEWYLDSVVPAHGVSNGPWSFSFEDGVKREAMRILLTAVNLSDPDVAAFEAAALSKIEASMFDDSIQFNTSASSGNPLSSWATMSNVRGFLAKLDATSSPPLKLSTDMLRLTTGNWDGSSRRTAAFELGVEFCQLGGSSPPGWEEQQRGIMTFRSTRIASSFVPMLSQMYQQYSVSEEQLSVFHIVFSVIDFVGFGWEVSSTRNSLDTTFYPGGVATSKPAPVATFAKPNVPLVIGIRAACLVLGVLFGIGLSLLVYFGIFRLLLQLRIFGAGVKGRVWRGWRPTLVMGILIGVYLFGVIFNVILLQVLVDQATDRSGGGGGAESLLRGAVSLKERRATQAAIWTEVLTQRRAVEVAEHLFIEFNGSSPLIRPSPINATSAVPTKLAFLSVVSAAAAMPLGESPLLELPPQASGGEYAMSSHLPAYYDTYDLVQRHLMKPCLPHITPTRGLKGYFIVTLFTLLVLLISVVDVLLQSVSRRVTVPEPLQASAAYSSSGGLRRIGGATNRPSHGTSSLIGEVTIPGACAMLCVCSKLERSYRKLSGRSRLVAFWVSFAICVGITIGVQVPFGSYLNGNPLSLSVGVERLVPPPIERQVDIDNSYSTPSVGGELVVPAFVPNSTTPTNTTTRITNTILTRSWGLYSPIRTLSSELLSSVYAYPLSIGIAPAAADDGVEAAARERILTLLLSGLGSLLTLAVMAQEWTFPYLSAFYKLQIPGTRMVSSVGWWLWLLCAVVIIVQIRLFVTEGVRWIQDATIQGRRAGSHQSTSAALAGKPLTSTPAFGGFGYFDTSLLPFPPILFFSLFADTTNDASYGPGNVVSLIAAVVLVLIMFVAFLLLLWFTSARCKCCVKLAFRRFLEEEEDAEDPVMEDGDDFDDENKNDDDPHNTAKRNRELQRLEEEAGGAAFGSLKFAKKAKGGAQMGGSPKEQRKSNAGKRNSSTSEGIDAVSFSNVDLESDVWHCAFMDDAVRMCSILEQFPEMLNARGGFGLICDRTHSEVTYCYNPTTRERGFNSRGFSSAIARAQQVNRIRPQRRSDAMLQYRNFPLAENNNSNNNSPPRQVVTKVVANLIDMSVLRATKDTMLQWALAASKATAAVSTGGEVAAMEEGIGGGSDGVGGPAKNPLAPSGDAPPDTRVEGGVSALSGGDRRQPDTALANILPPSRSLTVPAHPYAATPLHYAIAAGARSTINSLLNRGASLSLRTTHGLLTCEELADLAGTAQVLDSVIRAHDGT